MITYVYLVKCPNCADEPFEFFDDAKEFALGCLNQKPIITQTEVCRNDFGECTDSCDLGTVWSWEDANDTAKCIRKQCGKPIPKGMTIKQLVEQMEENEDTVECTQCEELFDKSECRKEANLGWLCSRCQAAIKSRGKPLTFIENNYRDFLNESNNTTDKTKTDKVSTEKATKLTEAITQVDDFSKLSEQQIKQLSNKIIDKINAEHLFFDFDITLVGDPQVDAATGDLLLQADSADTVYVSRQAHWTCSIYDEDCTEEAPKNPEFAEDLMDDIQEAFPTKTISIDGYSVTMTVWDAMYTTQQCIPSEIINAEEEDDGIGSYEYWGQIGWDSRPYRAIDGILDCPVSISISLTVTPKTVNTAQ